MKCAGLFCIVLSIILASTTEGAWIAYQRANRSYIKNYEKHCFETNYKIGAMDEGSKARIPKMCAIAECLENRDVKYRGCPWIELRDTACEVYQDLEKQYPDCCFLVKCNEASD